MSTKKRNRKLNLCRECRQQMQDYVVPVQENIAAEDAHVVLMCCDNPDCQLRKLWQNV